MGKRAPAISPTELVERMIVHGFPPQTARMICRHNEISEATFRNEQMFFFKQICTTTYKMIVQQSTMAILFHVSQGNVGKILSRASKNRSKIGHPRHLTENDEKSILDHITKTAALGGYSSKKALRDYVHEKFHIQCTNGWVHSFLSRNSENLRVERIHPRDDLRCTVPYTHIMKYFTMVQENVSGTSAELVINIDEMGSSEWANKKIKKVIVPNSLDLRDLHYPVNRRTKHVTFVAGICASGDCLKPLILTSQKKSLEVFKIYRNNIDFSVKIRDPAYMDQSLFLEYLKDIVLPFIEKQRRTKNLSRQKAVIFSDNVNCHRSDEVQKILGDNNVLLFTFPPHSSHMTQMLDLVTFGNLKNRMRTVKEPEKLSREAIQIYKLFYAWCDSTNLITIQSAFRRAGFDYEPDGDTFKLKFDQSYFTSTTNFCEIVRNNVSETDLSPRQQRTIWGPLNQRYLIPSPPSRIRLFLR
jgi:hypothetical protein